MNRDDFMGRTGALNALHFAEAVLKRAKTGLRKGAQARNQQDDSEEEDFDEDAAQDEATTEDDLEDAAIKGHIDVAVDEDEEGLTGETATVEYVQLVAAFVLTLLENSLTTYTIWVERNRTCPLCRADDTTTEADQ
ncbi:hypothetical protein B0A49_05199 [Cryomyces minteri]|uniref:Uncharacterized protein n=1 Tax=Cryomyces minteri TaxID=331657 RepID=A0A4U0XPB2_9PEZI|nr:hypothetical protein B0A49_05199 [Cryomyces minteri]